MFNPTTLYSLKRTASVSEGTHSIDLVTVRAVDESNGAEEPVAQVSITEEGTLLVRVAAGALVQFADDLEGEVV